jgi:hypothetical protein
MKMNLRPKLDIVSRPQQDEEEVQSKRPGSESLV